MKLLPILISTLIAFPAWADDESFIARAKVVKVEPQYEWVRVDRPRTRCWDEKVYDDDDDYAYDDILPRAAAAARTWPPWRAPSPAPSSANAWETTTTGTASTTDAAARPGTTGWKKGNVWGILSPTALPEEPSPPSPANTRESGSG